MNENSEPETGSHDHHGQDGERETLTTGESQRALSGEQEQRLPSMSQNNADDIEKVAGILVQTRADMATEPRERVVQALTERLEQAGVAVSGQDVEELADQITAGDAPDPEG